MDMNFRNTEKILSYRLKCKQIIEEVEKVFLGNREAVRKVLMTLLAGGHVLLEDIPGVGKTTLATAFSKALDLDCNRIQFTPDIMPSDVTGFTMLRQDTRAFEYRPGAAMCNLLLADVPGQKETFFFQDLGGEDGVADAFSAADAFFHGMAFSEIDSHRNAVYHNVFQPSAVQRKAGKGKVQLS